MELIVLIFVFHMFNGFFEGTSSNEKGKIQVIAGQQFSVSWSDKLGRHVENFSLSELGNDADIAKAGDHVKLHVKIPGVFDRLTDQLNTMGQGSTNHSVKEEVEITGLDLWFFQKWFR
jgi:hypothetical protein